MFDIALVKEIILQTLSAIEKIERRASGINKADDFVSSNAGLDMLDSIGMMLIAIGESCKNLDKITGGDLLNRYSEVDWKGAKGMRDVISHHYYTINPEIIFSVCRKQIPLLRKTFETMLQDFDKDT